MVSFLINNLRVLHDHAILFTLLITLTYSCSDLQSDNTGWGERSGFVTTIDVQKSDRFLFMDSLFNDYNIIKLADIEKGVIGNIDQVIISDTTIIVLDAFLSKSIFIFHTDGRFIRKLGQTGSGPGEYVKPISIDLDQDTLYVYDSGNGRIHKYLLDGEFVGYGPNARDIQIIPSAVSHIDEKYIFFSPYGDGLSNENYLLNIINYDSKLIYSDVPSKDINNLRINFGKSIYKNGDEIFFCQLLNDSLYSLNTKTLEISTPYVLNFKNDLLTALEFRTLSSNKSMGIITELMNVNKTIGIVKVYSNNQYHWLQYLLKGNLVNLVIDRSTNKARVFDYLAQAGNNSFSLSSPIGSLEDNFIFYNSSEVLESTFDLNNTGSGYLILAKK